MNLKAKDISEFSLVENVQQMFSVFRERFKEKEMFLICVPGRVNLLGTHVDHRGGWLNYIAIDRKFWIVGSKRNDSKVVAINLDSRYPAIEFDIKNESPQSDCEWEKAIRKIKVEPSWANYIKCAFLYLQHKMPDKNINGCNLVCWGNVPQEVGLSSSSTIVTSSMIAACYTNRIEMQPEQIVECAGRAEWYVGTRGGCGDHAAMTFSKKQSLCHIQFYPFRYEYYPFFKNIDTIIVNSLIEAKKSSEAKGAFNQRVACYEIGLRIIKKKHPELKDTVRYLRDINPTIFKKPEKICDLLMELPETVTRNQLYQMLPEYKEDLDIIFQTHPDSGNYWIRDVVSYGIFECERSRVCTQYLLNGDIAGFGRLMYISHDGDRVVSYNDSEKEWQWHADDRTLTEIKEKMKKNKGKSLLHLIPGRYSCSTKELDFIVDNVKKIEGVYGAKLTGAGLGGCVVILAESSSTAKVVDVLEQKYYRTKGLKTEIYVCQPQDGAKILEIKI